MIATKGTTATGLLGNAKPADGDTLTVNGKTITFRAGTAPASTAVASGSGVSGHLVTDGSGNTTVYLGSTGTPATLATVGDLLDRGRPRQRGADGFDHRRCCDGRHRVNQTASSVGAAKVTLESSTGADLSSPARPTCSKALGLTDVFGCRQRQVNVNRTTSASSLSATFAGRFDAERRRPRHHLQERADPGLDRCSERSERLWCQWYVVTDGNGNSTVYLQAGTVNDVLKAIDLATGVQTATSTSTAPRRCRPRPVSRIRRSTTSGQLKISTGSTADLSITGTGNALNVLGLGRQHRARVGVHRGAHLRCRRHQRQDPDLLLLQRRHGGQRHLRRRHQRHGEDAEQLNAALLADNLTATSTPTAC